MLAQMANLLVLMISAALGAWVVVRWLALGGVNRTLHGAIAWGTVAVAWCLGSAMILALPAELFQVPLVQMPLIATVSVALAGAVALLARGHVSEPAPLPSTNARTWQAWRRLSPAAKAALVLPVVGLHGLLLVEGLLRPPAAWDGLYYHLPLMVRWLRAGRLVMIPEVWQFCLPSNCELWQTFFASTGIERVIEPSLAPIGVLLALVVAGISRELGATAGGAWVCALFTLACPMVAGQMYGSYVDMFGATFTAGSLYWLLRLARHWPTGRERTAYGLLSGLSLGLAIGTKLSFVVWAGAVMACLAVIALVQWHRQRRGQETAGGYRRWAWLLAFVLATPVCSGFWFARSAYHTGWILHPIRLQVAGRTMGTGPPMKEIVPDLSHVGWKLRSYPWIEPKREGYCYGVDNGLGPSFAAFAVVGSFYLLVRRRWVPDPAGRFVTYLVLGFIVVGVVLFVEVCFSYARYALPLWVVMIAACAPLIDLLLWGRPRTSVALLGATLTLSAVMIGLWPAKTLLGRVCAGNLSRAFAYQMPELFDELAPGTVILNLGGASMSYPLLGAGWRNEVIEPITARAGSLLPPLSSAQIEARGIDIVYTKGTDPPPFAAEVVYETIYDSMCAPGGLTGKPVRVYRVRRGA